MCNGPELTTEFCKDLITINSIEPTKLTRLALPKMVNDPLPVAGANRFVINISSLSGIYTVPYLSVYGATKAYIAYFSRALAYELKGTCVRVQAFTPSFVSTNMFPTKRNSVLVPSALNYVNSALSMLGVETVGCGYLPHGIALHLLSLIPSCIRVAYLAKEMMKVRERFLRKQKKQ